MESSYLINNIQLIISILFYLFPVLGTSHPIFLQGQSRVFLYGALYEYKPAHVFLYKKMEKKNCLNYNVYGF